MVKAAENKVSPEEIEGFAEPIYQQTLKNILDFAAKLQARHTGYDSVYKFQQRALDLFGIASKRDGIELVPLVRELKGPGDLATANVFLSGKGYTTRKALEEIKKAQLERGLVSLLGYSAFVSDDPASAADSLGRFFKIPSLVVDYFEFCRQHGENFEIRGEAITGTSPSNLQLEDAERQRRLELRVRYDEHLDEQIRRLMNGHADLDLLRGYRFLRATRRGLDTHPAPLNYLNQDGSPAYAGWQKGAVAPMIRDGFLQDGWGFRSSMMLTNPIRTLDDLKNLDAGDLIMLGPNVEILKEWIQRYDLKDESQILALAGNIQDVLKITGDVPLIVFESLAGAPYLFAVSKEPHPKRVFSIRRTCGSGYEYSYVTKPAVYCLDKESTGSNAFVLDKKNLDNLAEKLRL